MDLFEQISKEAQKCGDFIAEKATQVKDYTVATWTAAELRNQIDALYKTIGQAVWRAHTTGEDTAEEIEANLEELSALQDALREKEVEKQALKNKKLCPSCNRAIAKDHAYCPHCGASIQ